MLGNKFETVDAKDSENGIEVMKESATDPPRPKHTVCQLCRLSNIRSSQVRPNRLQDCKCEELSPYDNPKITRYAQRSKVNVAESLNSLEEDYSSDAKQMEQYSFVPPQGMDTGHYPERLFYQYYPNQNKDYTFDLLPLPFMERLKYQERCTLSMEYEDVEKKWKDFLYDLPNRKLQSTKINPDNKFWRWKNYLRYASNENRNEFRYKMQVGPKYDSVRRLPIIGDDLQIFREMKTNLQMSSKYFLKKGDGATKK